MIFWPPEGTNSPRKAFASVTWVEAIKELGTQARQDGCSPGSRGSRDQGRQEARDYRRLRKRRESRDRHRARG